MKLTFLSCTLIWALFTNCGKPQEPEFRQIKDFKLKKIGLIQADVGFQIVYFNPNSFGVTVKETVDNVYVDSLFLGRFSQDSGVLAGRNAVFSIPVNGEVALATVLKLNLADVQNKRFHVRAEGSCRVGKAGVFIKRSVHYEGDHRLDELGF